MPVRATDETMSGTIGGLKVSAGSERTINVGGDSALVSTGSISLADAANVIINGDLKTSSSINMSREGTGTGAKTFFTLNGDLSMRNTDKDNPYIGGGNQFYSGTGRWASTGIDISMTSGSIMNFNGNVDMAVKGTAVETDPFYKDYSGDNYNWSTGKVGPITDSFRVGC